MQQEPMETVLAQLPTSSPPLVKPSKAKPATSAKPAAGARVASGKTAAAVVPFADRPVPAEPAMPIATAIVLPPVIDPSPGVTRASAPIEITPAAPVPVVANPEESTMNEPLNTTNANTTHDAMHKVEESMHTAANTMHDAAHTATNTMHDAAQSAGHKATEMFGDMNTRAKDAMAKGTKAIEEFVEFSKENMEALATSSRVAAKGAEEIAKYGAEYGRSTIEKANATAKQFAAVKSPTEFFQLQGEVAKQTLDALVAEGSKFTENYLKLLGEVTQPISNRVAVAADKMKPTNNG